MSNNGANMGTRLSAIAIAQEQDRLRAVELQKQGGAFEVLWTKSSETSGADRRVFAAECGLSVEPTGQADGDKLVVVGSDSSSVAFYRIGLPPAKEEEMASMVRLQAETLLPLPAEQMELTWRADPLRDGKVPITIAAARKEQLQKFVEDVRVFEPAKILLGCEAIVKAWRVFFSGNKQDAVVVSMGARKTQVCLAEGGRLSNAVVLDMGMEDLPHTTRKPSASETTRNLPTSADERLAEQTEATERFAQDMRSVLELFGYADIARSPVFVLSDGGSAAKTIVSCLESAGLNAQAALPQIENFRAQKELGVEAIYEYRVPIGLALMALEVPADELNIFEHLYKPAVKEESKSRLYSPIVTGAIAAVMLALLVIVSYAVDMASPNAIERRLKAAASDSDIDLLMQRHKLIKTVAQERPDLLQLLNRVNAIGNKGIMLDSLHFKKNRPISITGQVQEAEQLYEFQKSLQSEKSIKEVKIQSTSRDSKSKKVKFTITFHYKNFTKKRTRT